ncbi:MAG: HD domain-containing protein [Nitrosopumilaceae archaeon]
MIKMPKLKPEQFPRDLSKRCVFVRSFIEKEGKHPAWGANHSLRIYRVALELAKKENLKVDNEVLFIVAMLHDVGAFGKFKKEGTDHSDRSIEFFKEHLRLFGFKAGDEKIGHIVATMKGHMFYRSPENSNEALLLRDADILDFLGNTAIARLYSIIGKDEWTPTVEKTDERLHHFYKNLPQKLKTDSAKKIAQVKKKEMKRFFESRKHRMKSTKS